MIRNRTGPLHPSALALPHLDAVDQSQTKALAKEHRPKIEHSSKQYNATDTEIQTALAGRILDQKPVPMQKEVGHVQLSLLSTRRG